MQRSLMPHPDTPCTALSAVTATLTQAANGILSIDYVAHGKIDDVCWPARAPAQRVDGLWQASCFELFVAVAGKRHYAEFNFSPSTAWAAYQFQDYRNGMTSLRFADAPSIETDLSAHRFSLRASMPFPLPAKALIGLSAVIEQTDSTKSYWALAHPPGKPDFHHRDCFAHQLKAADRS